MIGVQIDDVSRIKAFVICPDGVADQAVLSEQLREWCKEHLRRYEYPHVVAFVADFPRTATGKIQRFKLREAEAVAAAAEIAAMSSVREQLAGSMADVRAVKRRPGLTRRHPAATPARPGADTTAGRVLLPNPTHRC